MILTFIQKSLKELKGEDEQEKSEDVEMSDGEEKIQTLIGKKIIKFSGLNCYRRKTSK